MLSERTIKKQTRKEYERMVTKYRKTSAVLVEKCFYCQIKLNHEVRNLPNSSSVDHYIPIGKGGTNDESNLKVCCHSCNSHKGNINPKKDSKRWSKFCKWVKAKKASQESELPLKQVA